MGGVRIESYFNTAQSLFKEGKLSEAKKLVDEVLAMHKTHLPSLLLKAKVLVREGKTDEALSFLQRAHLLHPSDINIPLLEGKILVEIGALEKARVIFDSLLKIAPNVPQILFQAARCFRKLGETEKAKSAYKRLLEVVPGHIQASNNLANIYQLDKKYKEALSLYDTLLSLGVKESLVFTNKASLLYKMGKESEAEMYFLEALREDLNNSLAHFNLALIYTEKLEFKKAKKCINNALAIESSSSKFLSMSAVIDYSCGSRNEAKTDLQKLIAKYPNQEEPHLKLARIYFDELTFDLVVSTLQPFLHRQSDSIEAHFLLGLAFDQLQHYENAIIHLKHVITKGRFSLKSLMLLQSVYSKSGVLKEYEAMLSSISKELTTHLEEESRESELPVYNLAYYPFDLHLSRRVLKKHAEGLENRMDSIRKKVNFAFTKQSRDRLRIGYISPNLRVHPDALLTKDLFRYHDRDKYDIHAFSLRSSDDEVAAQIKSDADHFHDVSHLSSVETAQLIYDQGIDVLTCLSGYNLGMRMEIPALRPAPIQTMYMGYNESTQASFIDYVFGDEVVLTEKNRSMFSESMVQLPVSYFANSSMTPSDVPARRSDYDIPENAFVFGCLNHPRKIGPDSIAAWAQILRGVPNAVLWLYKSSEQIEKNFRQAFSDLSIDPTRILFCSNEPYKDHLRRFELIDLFLDTPVYNGHTTSLEALWMGVPVLTVKGETVSARLCSSFLTSLSLEPFICDGMDSYAKKAIEFGANPALLEPTRNHLGNAKSKMGILNPEQQVRTIEKAYDQMWERYGKGLEPIDFKIN